MMSTSIWAILSLPIFLFLPGYLVVNYFTSSRASKIDLTVIEGFFLSIALSSALTGVVALALAQAGWFGLFALIIILVLFSLVVAIAALMDQRSLVWNVESSSGAEWLIVAVLIIGAGALFLRPHEYVLGGSDAGVYVNLGANLAKTGAWLIREPLLASIEPDLLPGLLREQPPTATTRFIRLPGFYLSGRVPGLVVPQFYPLHPVWLGIGYSLFSTDGTLLTTPVWSILSVAVIYLYGRSLFGRQTGGLTGFLLLIVPLQVYFARYPTAEPLTQYLIWTGLWAFSAFDRGRSLRELWGLVAGLTLGQSFLARIDTLPLLLVPIVWLLGRLWHQRWRSSEWWFLLPLAGSIGYAVYHGLVFSRPYTLDLYGWAVPFLLHRWWPAVVVGVFLIGFLVLGGRYLSRWNQLRKIASEGVIRRLAAALLLAAGIYAYFVRPRIGATVLAPYWYSDSRVPVSNHKNLVRLGWYLSPLGIGLAVFGGVLVLLKERWSKVWPLFGVGGTFAVLYTHNILNNPFQIYAMRRYVPVVVPFCILLAAYALCWLWQWFFWPKVGRIVCVILLLIFTGWLVYSGRLILGQVDLKGAVDQVEQVADDFEANSIVLFVDPAPVGLGAVLGTPLQFLHGVTCFDLQEAALDTSMLRTQISRWIDAGYTVYFARKPGTSDILHSECLTPSHTAELVVQRLEQSYDHAPSQIEQVHYRTEVFRVAFPCLSRDD